MNRATAAARRVDSRDPKWWEFEQKWLDEHPQCEACPRGFRQGGLQVHHIIPWQHFHGLGRADLEFDPRNLIVLCETIHRSDPAPCHHLYVGHLGAFTRVNLTVREDAALFRGMTKAQLLDDPRWLQKRLALIKPFHHLNKVERVEFRQVIDAMFPEK